jgi:hypothetical protein
MSLIDWQLLLLLRMFVNDACRELGIQLPLVS